MQDLPLRGPQPARQPGFTLTATLTLGFGIAANTRLSAPSSESFCAWRLAHVANAAAGWDSRSLTISGERAAGEYTGHSSLAAIARKRPSVSLLCDRSPRHAPVEEGCQPGRRDSFPRATIEVAAARARASLCIALAFTALVQRLTRRSGPGREVGARRDTWGTRRHRGGVLRLDSA